MVKQFVASAPVTAPADKATHDWAARQFRDLQTVIGDNMATIATLQARVSALEAIVSDGSWDGGTP